MNAVLVHRKIVAGRGAAAVMLHASLGFGWHKPAGRSTGACPLTGNPFTSTFFGMVVGALIATGLR